jgi:hypothetical protein
MNTKIFNLALRIVFATLLLASCASKNRPCNSSGDDEWPSSGKIVKTISHLIDLNEASGRMKKNLTHVYSKSQINRAGIEYCSKIIDLEDYQAHLNALQDAIKLETRVNRAKLMALKGLLDEEFEIARLPDAEISVHEKFDTSEEEWPQSDELTSNMRVLDILHCEALSIRRIIESKGRHSASDINRFENDVCSKESSIDSYREHLIALGKSLALEARVKEAEWESLNGLFRGHL